jgi:hypothetical protein
MAPHTSFVNTNDMDVYIFTSPISILCLIIDLALLTMTRIWMQLPQGTGKDASRGKVVVGPYVQYVLLKSHGLVFKKYLQKSISHFLG